VKFLACLVDSSAVIRIDNEDKALGAWRARGFSSETPSGPVSIEPTREIVSPERTDLVLATDIPHVELDVLVCHGLDVEADGRDGRDVLVQPELVEDSCATEKGVSSAIVMNGSRKRGEVGALVFPAASSPSIRRRISLDPKTLLINLETCPPMAPAELQRSREKRGTGRERGERRRRCVRRETVLTGVQ
jgi:hypothetical protein